MSEDAAVVRSLTLNSLNKVVVSAYKGVGFVVLGVLLFGLLSFMGLNVFFFCNHSWVAPTVLSPTDERVLMLANQVALQRTARDKLVADRAELQARLEHARRDVAAQEAFQAEFRRAIASDIAARQEELHRVERLRAQFVGSKGEIVRSNETYAEQSRSRLEQLKAARLVDPDSYASAAHQLTEIAQANLGLEETQARLDQRAAALERDLLALRAMHAATATGGTAEISGNVGYEVLRMKEEFSHAAGELARARADQAVAETALGANAAAVERYERMLKALEDSPYSRATTGRVTLAFVPYENVTAVRPGAPLVACSLTVLWCKRVGQVVAAVDGEVAGRHPIHAQPERGVMVRVDLTDPQWAKERVLFAGRAPLFL